MKRRDFITLLGGAAVAWPIAARAQQPGMPVIGYLRASTRTSLPQREAAFREGLGSMGFREGINVAIDYRYAGSDYDRMPALAADLVRSGVAVLYAGENIAAVAAKAATTNIPIVFRLGGDPVGLGLVKSLNQPGGNVTGVTFLSTVTEAIRLQMLHEAVPGAAIVGLLVNPSNPNSDPDTQEVQEAARKLGLELHVVSASSPQEIDTAFATLVMRRAQALVIDGDSFLTQRRQQLATLATRHGMPSIYATRDFPDAGGLMSYGASNIEADRQAGIYVGRILKGEKPANLPVQQSVKVELVINLIVAKALGIDFPLTLLGRADEVIE
jgi:putative ABC transport system substrate-binding protein